MTYYVQQNMGGWKQTATFHGTKEECQEYYKSRNLDTQTGWSIVSEDEYEVDYLF